MMQEYFSQVVKLLRCGSTVVSDEGVISVIEVEDGYAIVRPLAVIPVPFCVVGRVVAEA